MSKKTNALTEAINFKNVAKVGKLIAQYLAKKTKTDWSYVATEEVTIGGRKFNQIQVASLTSGKAVGIELDINTSVSNNSPVVGVSYYKKGKRFDDAADLNISFDKSEDVSLVKVLPSLVPVILDKVKVGDKTIQLVESVETSQDVVSVKPLTEAQTISINAYTPNKRVFTKDVVGTLVQSALCNFSDFDAALVEADFGEEYLGFISAVQALGIDSVDSLVEKYSNGELYSALNITDDVDQNELNSTFETIAGSLDEIDGDVSGLSLIERLAYFEIKTGRALTESLLAGEVEPLNESIDILEQAINFAIDQSASGEGFTLTDMDKKVNIKAYHIFTRLLKNVPSLFRKEGRKIFVNNSNTFEKEVKDIVTNGEMYQEFLVTVSKGRVAMPSSASPNVTKALAGTGLSIDSTEEEIEKISFESQLEDLSDGLRMFLKGAAGFLFGVGGIGGIGKTYTVEKELNAANQAYTMVKGGGSAIGLYTLLYQNRAATSVLFIDDADSLFGDQDCRNLLKAATDTKKVRTLMLAKKSASIYDPNTAKGRAIEQAKADLALSRAKGAADLYDEDEEDGFDSDDGDKFDIKDPEALVPNKFEFKGKVIFISNLPINKLDGDGALRTRGIVIDLQPSRQELIDYMKKLLYKMEPSTGLKISDQRREMAFKALSTSSRASGMSIRSLVRALDMASTDDSDEKIIRLIQRYA